jgi:hypothetical protein
VVFGAWEKESIFGAPQKPKLEVPQAAVLPGEVFTKLKHDLRLDFIAYYKGEIVF